MPNNEHVAILAHGAEVWNGWRADRDEMPDLSRAGLVPKAIPRPLTGFL